MNRLADETSPYLLQHAHNPVNWYPWGKEALQQAKTENKPILVSIGYAACHWCHVMERESFKNVETADLMNAHFINIKIDREERPDLDAIYMEAVQLIAGNGGWPLNVFLTPDARPFYGGTYFPPVAAHSRSSWPDVLEAIKDAWQQRPHEILSQADNLTAHIGSANFLSNLTPQESPFTLEQLDTAATNLLKVADKQWGGFSRAPKFPQTGSILYLLRHSYFQKQYGKQTTDKAEELAETALQQALLSLDKMIFGGIYDQLAGGFARYATDPHWQIPHFEKMLYDNALLINVLSEAFQFTGKPLYRQVIEQTIHFIQTNWVSPEGGFYAAYDADSEGVEGKFYTWGKAEIETVAEGEWAKVFCQYYQVTEEGNWEETNILWCLQPIEVFCQKENLDLLETEKHFASIRQKLLQVRSNRIPPLLDDKILLSWNALTITACCKAYAAVGDANYLQMAEKAAFFIECKMKDATGYYHNYKGKAANPAFLDDLAFYIQALIHLQEATANQQYLLTAQAIMKDLLERFADPESPFFYYTAIDQPDIIVRKKEWYDGATPSGNSVMAENLFYLSIVFDKPEWKQQAMGMIQQLNTAIVKYPSSFANAGLVMQLLVHGIHEISVNGEMVGKTLQQLLVPYWPDKLVQTQQKPDNTFPLFHNRWPAGKEGKVFLCKDEVCMPPLETIADVLRNYR